MSTPTNEPKMPEEVKLIVASDGQLLFSIDGTPYHHDDKVQGLKEALRECVSALSLAVVGSCSCGIKSPEVTPHNDYCLYKVYSLALTKASNLLK